MRTLLLSLCLAFALGACNDSSTQLQGTDQFVQGEAWDPVALVISANAVGGTPGIDTVFTRGAMTAVLKVVNGNGPEVGSFDVTLAYEFSEVSDSVELIAPGVYRLADPEITKVGETGTVTLSLAPNGEASVEVPLGIPRPLTQMSASRHFMFTNATVTRIALHGTDSLNATTLIRLATTTRNVKRLESFGRLSTIYGGLVLPALVPGDVRLEGATLDASAPLGSTGETVWDFVKNSGATARLVFDVHNQAPFSLPPGIPWVIGYDAAEPVLVEGETIWPQVTLVGGSTPQAIGPGETLTIDPGLSSDFTEDPDRLPEYVLLVDTESVARTYPIILAGQPVRAWLNIVDSAPASN